MSKSVRSKDLTDKISFGLTKIDISASYFIVRTDKIFKISPNDWHVQKDFNISGCSILFDRCGRKNIMVWFAAYLHLFFCLGMIPCIKIANKKQTKPVGLGQLHFIHIPVVTRSKKMPTVFQFDRSKVKFTMVFVLLKDRQ